MLKSARKTVWLLKRPNPISQGIFRLTSLPGVEPGQSIVLNFQHPDYLPVKMQATVGDHLYVVEMAPVHGEVEASLTSEKERSYW